jgi:GTP-binding protein HflX
VREADLLIHVADISHPEFEDQINVVKQTLTDIKASDKPTIILFNKIDLYEHEEKEPDDLTPVRKKNITLEEMEKTWVARSNEPSLFISATEKINLTKLREMIYNEVKSIRIRRYPSLDAGNV